MVVEFWMYSSRSGTCCYISCPCKGQRGMILIPRVAATICGASRQQRATAQKHASYGLEHVGTIAKSTALVMGENSGTTSCHVALRD